MRNSVLERGGIVRELQSEVQILENSETSSRVFPQQIATFLDCVKQLVIRETSCVLEALKSRGAFLSDNCHGPFLAMNDYASFWVSIEVFKVSMVRTIS